MQISLENTGNLERKLTVKIPRANLTTKINERMQKLAGTVRIKGFRPGKVPAKVVEQRFGDQVRQEALSEVISSSYQAALKDRNLRPAAAPAIVTNENDQDIEYTATFEVVPELGAVEVSELPITKFTATVEDEDVERMIETLRMQRRSWHPVERPSRAGDMVLFEYRALGAEAQFPKEGMERAGVVLGSGALFPEFEDLLTDVATGAEKTASLRFPENFRESSLAGKSAETEIKIGKIQEPQLPELDDTFVALFGTRGGVAQFKNDVRANLERELLVALRNRTKAGVVDSLVERYQSVEIPRAMVKREAQALLSQAQARAKQANMPVPAEIAPYAAMAEKRVRAFLVLTEVARQKNVMLDGKRVREELALVASTYEEPEKVVQVFASDEEFMNKLRNGVLEDQVIDWIVEHAQKKEEKLSFQQAMQQQA